MDFIRSLPKAELHLHIEGSLEPELMFELAERNQVALSYQSVEELRNAYSFNNLQEFLDIYYAGASVLQTRRDFCDLVLDYAKRAAADGVVHAEIFFDPQTHLERGVSFDEFFEGLHDGIERASAEHGISFKLIMSFLRHLSEEDAFRTLEAAEPFLDRIAGVGLDSSEQGNPPAKFERVFSRCKELGLKRVAHAGEEGPADYIWDSLKLLDVCRVDHGVAAPTDAALMEHLVQTQTPLTVCPCSNVCLKVFDHHGEANAVAMLREGVCVTINSDDPAYFGGYIGKNYEVLRHVGMTDHEAVDLAANSIRASWLHEEQKQRFLDKLHEIRRSIQ